jgi:hypothetical protein
MTGRRASIDAVRSNLVVSARITPLPQRLGDPLPEVWVTCQDGTETKVFDYYPDEITFAEGDFVGLTVEECRLLKFGRDRAFLQR